MATGRETLSYRDVAELIQASYDRTLTHINGYGAKVAELEREMDRRFEKVDVSLQSLRESRAEGRGRDRAIAALFGIVAAFLSSLLLQAMREPQTSPGAPASPQAITIVFTAPPAPRSIAGPLTVTLRTAENGESQPTPNPNPTPSATPSPSVSPPTLGRVICGILPREVRRDLCRPRTAEHKIRGHLPWT